MKRIAIIGASYLQLPLIRKAKEMGLETHVFAWRVGDDGEKEADQFYPISIIEKETILAICRKIKIDGICTISSDLAVITVNYVAEKLGLVSNSFLVTERSTNKHLMRERFVACGDPSPLSIMVRSADDLRIHEMAYPLIVKPTDRSGSRGITKVFSANQLPAAIHVAIEQSFEKAALVEEFAQGQEYSVEFVSWNGQHHFLNITKKYTTGAPHFVEIGHLEPADISKGMQDRIKATVSHALDSLGIQYGASHSEIKIDENEQIRIIEIGGRMGGDCIGSSLVPLTTGFDYMKAVIEISLGKEPEWNISHAACYAAVRFIFTEKDITIFESIQKTHPEILVDYELHEIKKEEIVDSSGRNGYFVICSKNKNIISQFLPKENE